ncbi:MAG: PEP-CTERM sorting domain-containing protein, partial [Chthoniobacteraceae bacterium]
YDLIGYTGSIAGTGTSALSVLNQQAGKNYTFGIATGGTNYVTLTISDSVTTTATTYTLAASATTTKLFTSGTTAIASAITNTGTGTADKLDYNNLGAGATGGTVSGSTTSGTGVANSGGSATNSGQIYTAGSTSGTFAVSAVVTSATNHTIGGSATLSGSTVATVNVYDQAALTTSTTAATQGTPANLVLTNGTSTGGASGQRAGVTVTTLAASNVLSTDNTNNFAAPTLGGSAVVADAHGTPTTGTMGNAAVLAKRLNGTYTETVSGSSHYTDSTLAGQQSVGNQTWNITAITSGNASTSRSDVYSANVLAGKTYGTSNSAGLSLGSNLTGTHQPTTATLLSGSLTATATTNVNMSFDKTAANAVTNAFRTSDILTLSGLNSTSPVNAVQLTDTYVLQLSYDTSVSGVQYLGWNNGLQFVNAISGDNTGNTNPFGDGSEVVGAYSGQTTVGTYGYDPTNDVVWAVLNHLGATDSNGNLIGGTNEFASIPEPGTWGMILGGFGMLVAFQKLRKRRVGI